MTREQRKSKGVKTLPGNLGEALQEFAKDRYLKESLGEHFSTIFLKSKNEEWDSFNHAVHEWERKRYLDV
jgi:glutamine synthetase